MAHDHISTTLIPKIPLLSSAFFSLSIPVWGWLDIAFALMVLVGVAGESTWLGLDRILIREKPNDLFPIELKRKKLRGICEFILIVGIAGELTCIPFSLLESSRLNKEAGDARKDAGFATERAAVAEKAAAQANELAAQIETTNAQLVAANLVVKKQLLELESIVQWRTITPAQETNLVNLLKPFVQADFMRKHVVGVAAAGDIAESRQYAKRIAEVLKLCGFDVDDFALEHSFFVRSGGPTGLEFSVQSAVLAPAHATAILKAFETEKIPLFTVENPKTPRERLEITVLPKPENR